MVESQKGASSLADSKKKSPFAENENEQDFLDSWKSTAGGKDVLDFSAEAVPRERKKIFYFGKLDDFELNAEFGNISSFKMDMSELDFSSPQKKTEKSKERLGKEALSGKMEGKKDHFSFSFDFNELDAFDIDTKLIKGEKKPKKCAESVLDIFENDVSNLPKLGCTTGSNSKDLVSSKVDLDLTNSSTSAPADLEQCGREAPTLQERQLTITQGGKDETNHSEDKRDCHGEHPLTTGSKKRNGENFVQDFSVQSDDCSPKEMIQQFRTGCPPSATVDANTGEEKDNSCVRSENYSQSETNSPAKEYDSKCLTALWIGASMSTDNAPEKSQSDQKNVGRSSVTSHESPKMQKDVGDNSVGPALNKTLSGNRSNEDKQRSSSKVLESSLHRYSKSEHFTTTKENRSSGLQVVPLNKAEATGSRLSSATTPKQLYAVCKKKMETMNIHPANKKSEHNGDKRVENHNSGNFKSLNWTLKAGSTAPVGDANHRESDTSLGIRRPVSSIETMNIVASVEKHEISLPNAVRNPDPSSMNISRITKSHKYLSNSLMKDAESIGHSKKNTVQHLKTSPSAAHSVTMEKSAVLSPPLKRKSVEGSHMDLLTLNSAKHILECPSEKRKFLQISPRVHGQVGLGSEITGGLSHDAYLDHQNPLLDVCVDGETMDIEVPISIENDGNIEKAEACTKELENICSMLKKKHEEAKELLIRAIINNNSLLMLDHPIYEEKICALQRFAASLLLKKYDT